MKKAKAEEELQVTPILSIKDKLFKVVKLPGWEIGEDFIVKVRQVGLLDLLKKGVLPNSLLPLVQKFIAADNSNENPMNEIVSDEEMLMKFNDMVERVCRAIMVEPKYDDAVEEGITVGDSMTDYQRLSLFLYSQRGAKFLDLFRKQQEFGSTFGDNGKKIRDTAELLP